MAPCSLAPIGPLGFFLPSPPAHSPQAGRKQGVLGSLAYLRASGNRRGTAGGRCLRRRSAQSGTLIANSLTSRRVPLQATPNVGVRAEKSIGPRLCGSGLRPTRQDEPCLLGLPGGSVGGWRRPRAAPHSALLWGSAANSSVSRVSPLQSGARRSARPCFAWSASVPVDSGHREGRIAGKARQT
jgi:hypothetical protein